MAQRAHRRVSTVLHHLKSHEKEPSPDPCGTCVNRHNCSGQMSDMEDMGGKCHTRPRVKIDSAAHMIEMLDARKHNHGLAGEFFSDPEVFDADLELIFHKEWLFVGHTIEIPEPGSYITTQAGKYPVIVLRGHDGTVRAFHNVCRHRGFKLCSEPTGKLAKNLVCAYHQWTYDIDDGKLKFARDMEDDFDYSAHGLIPVHMQLASTYIWICVAENPPDFFPVKALIEEYAEPYDLPNAKVAYQSRIIENGNWKLVWENNRECYHCSKNHPELIQSFPANWVQGSTADLAVENVQKEFNLPSKFAASEDNQYRVMRHFFVKGSTSMTLDGQPAMKNGKRMGRVPEGVDIGNVPFYHYPTTWNHWQADWAISFRVTPLSPTETEVVTTYIVPGDAQEGVDYDLKELTATWEATNKQDQSLVETVQQGVLSPAFVPGLYNEKHESGVIQFVDWYGNLLKTRLMEEHLPR